MKDIDEVIETLTEDIECSTYLKDWIVNRINDIEDRKNSFTLIKEDTGYMLSEYKDSVLIDSDMCFYISFI